MTKTYKILLNIAGNNGEFPLNDKDEAELLEVLQMPVGEFPAATMQDAAKGVVTIDPKMVKQYVHWLLNVIFNFDSVTNADVRLSIAGNNAAGYSRGYDRFDHIPTFNVAGRIADARRQLEK